MLDDIIMVFFYINKFYDVALIVFVTCNIVFFQTKFQQTFRTAVNVFVQLSEFFIAPFLWRNFHENIHRIIYSVTGQD